MLLLRHDSALPAPCTWFAGAWVIRDVHAHVNKSISYMDGASLL